MKRHTRDWNARYADDGWQLMHALTPVRHSVRGFTLVELLVSLFITALLFVLGYGTLNQALNSRKAIEEQTARLLAVQQAVRTMEQDFEALEPRPVRNSAGTGYDPALTTSAQSSTLSSLATADSSGGTAVVTFTRGGWTNPAGLQRSELQRVSYLFNGTQLIRGYWPVLDPTAATTQQQRVLLDKVKSISLRFLDAGRNWDTDWPTTAAGTNATAQGLRIRPVAIEVTLVLEDLGTIVRTIEIPG